MPTIRAVPLLAILLLIPGSQVRAGVKTAEADALGVAFSVHLKTPPARAYAATVRVGRWWSPAHTWSGDAAHLSLQDRAGGCFCEAWPDNEVAHGRVIAARRGQLLRLDAALGPLQAMAVTGVLSFAFKPEGEGTRLDVEYRVNGARSSGLDTIAPMVDQVLGEQVTRLERFVDHGSPDASTP